MNYMSNKIFDKLQDRIEIYLNLQRVYGFFKTFMEGDALDYEAKRRKIIMFQVFTNRLEDKEEIEIPPYIKQRGIKFNASELEVENDFLDLFSSLSKSITTIIENHIKEYNITITCWNVSINDIFSFKPELWCKEYLNDYATDGKKMVDHIYAKLNNLNNDYSQLELIGTKITKLYSKYLSRSTRNIKQIEKLYGRRLQYTISQQREVQENFDYLFKSLKEIENRITGQIEEHDEKIENYVECLEQINNSIDNLCTDVIELKEIILGLNI